LNESEKQKKFLKKFIKVTPRKIQLKVTNEINGKNHFMEKAKSKKTQLIKKSNDETKQRN